MRFCSIDISLRCETISIKIPNMKIRLLFLLCCRLKRTSICVSHSRMFHVKECFQRHVMQRMAIVRIDLRFHILFALFLLQTHKFVTFCPIDMFVRCQSMCIKFPGVRSRQLSHEFGLLQVKILNNMHQSQ